MQGNQREYQLSSVDQALMDELTNRVRECYEEMTRISTRVISSESLADTEFSRPVGEVLEEAQGYMERTSESFHDQEVCWPAGPDQEMCYKKSGGKVMIRPRRER
ncbi:hypothetical protein [Salinithrix halophila]|uniref:Uncharacterized protein n=1 Tax=Salinithrix halophila TaxID=1485204 RepID=A0ABV8JCD8_9BACL